MRNDETSESIPPEKKDIFCDDVIFSPDLSIIRISGRLSGNNSENKYNLPKSKSASFNDFC